MSRDRQPDVITFAEAIKKITVVVPENGAIAAVEMLKEWQERYPDISPELVIVKTR